MVDDRSTNLPTIAVAGAASVDIAIREAPNWTGSTGRDVFTADSLHALEKPVEMGLGGNGGASAYVLGRLGLPVELNAPMGDDPCGQLVRNWLEQAGVQCITPGPATSTMVSIVQVDGLGKRLGCLQHPGPRIDWELSAQSKNARWLLATAQAKVTVEELHAVRRTVQAFHGAGRTTVLDSGIGWMGAVESTQMHELWSHVDLLVGTVDELAAWTKEKTPQAIARAVLAHGVQQVVIKMGADGAAFQSRTQAFGRQSALPVKRADLSIGAGDAFNGALISSLAAGQTLSAAVSKGQQVAAKVVETGRGVVGWYESLGVGAPSRTPGLG